MPKACKKGAKVACIITGKTTYFNETALKKKVSKFGSVEDFKEYFVCNQAKRMLRQKMTVDEIRKQLNCSDDLPKVDLEILAKLKLLKKKKRFEDRIITDEKKVLIEQEQQKKIDDYKSDVKAYGAFGAWVREHTSMPNGLGTCQRPDIYLNNDEHCGKCEYFEFCMCRLWNNRKK